MKIFQKTLLIAAAALAFAACSEDFDSAVEPGFIEDEVQGEKVSMTLGFSVPDMVQTEVNTRAAAEDESLSVSLGAGPATRADYSAQRAAELKNESTVHNLWVLQFSANADAATKQVCKYYDNITNNQVSVDLYNNNGAKTPVYFIANAGPDAFKEYQSGVSGSKSLSHAAFKAMSLAVPEGGYNDDIASNGLPMLADTLLAAVTGTQTIRLTRTVAKVELILKQEGFNAFTATDLQLCDVPTKFFYVANGTNLKAVKANYSAETNSHGHFDNLFNVRAINGTSMKGGTEQRAVFYISENLRGTGASASPESKNWWNAPLHSSYIEIIGNHVDGSKTTAIEYCIFPGKNNTNDFNIERNTYYTINATIKGANLNGDGRVTVAGKAIDLNATNGNKTANCYIVEKATQIYCFDASKMGNGVNVPACNASTAATPAVTQAHNPIAAETMKPQSVKVLWEAGPAGHAKELISNVKVDTEENKVYFSTAGMIGGDRIPGNAVIATYDSANATGDVRWSWHIWFTENNLATTAVNHTSRAAGTKTYTIMGRNLGAQSNDAADVSAYGLLYQWGRKDPFVNSKALTGAEFAPSSKTDWGTDVIAAKAIPGATTGEKGLERIKYAVAHPTTFITQYVKDATPTSNVDTYDWVGGNSWVNQYDALWGNQSKVTSSLTVASVNTAACTKTMYDPCPVGWKMPAQDTWTAFTTDGNNQSTLTNFNVTSQTASWFTTNYGWQFYTSAAKNASVFYPAAGYRSGASGAMTIVGTGGDYWSSSSYAAGSIHAGRLNFYAGRVYPLGTGSRAFAFSVRCVQE